MTAFDPVADLSRFAGVLPSGLNYLPIANQSALSIRLWGAQLSSHYSDRVWWWAGDIMIELKVESGGGAMDVLTFVASIVGSVAWPIAAFAIAFLFRAQLRKLLDRIRKLSLGENSVDFGGKLDQAEAEADAALPAAQPDPLGSGLPDERTAQLISISPSAAVLDAWRSLETKVRTLANPLATVATQGRPRPLTFRAGVKYLLDAGQITGSTYVLLHDLQQLRNAAAHGDDVSAADALRFTTLAKQAMLFLEGPDVRPDPPKGD